MNVANPGGKILKPLIAFKTSGLARALLSAQQSTLP